MGAVALGINVHLGTAPPVLGSPAVVSLLTRRSEELMGGKFIVEPDPLRAAELLLEHINTAREKLGLPVIIPNYTRAESVTAPASIRTTLKIPEPVITPELMG